MRFAVATQVSEAVTMRMMQMVVMCTWTRNITRPQGIPRWDAQPCVCDGCEM